MKIIVDAQALQTDSKYRGIGNYVKNLLDSLFYHNDHSYVLLFNESLSTQDEKKSLQNYYEKFSSVKKIIFFKVIEKVNNKNTQDLNYILREHLVARLKPDLVFITSLFEGIYDKAVLSVNKYFKNIPHAILCYDLIPYFFSRDNFRYINDANSNMYQEKLNYLKDSKLIFTISEHSKNHIANFVDRSRIYNIDAALPNHFLEQKIDPNFLKRKRISNKYFLIVGGGDQRKNYGYMIKAFSDLPAEYKKNYSIFFIGKIDKQVKKTISDSAISLGLSKKKITFLNYVSNEDISNFYHYAELFIFPSYEEGFGLPILESIFFNTVPVFSDIEVFKELINDNDLIFSLNDSYDLTNLLIKFIKDPTIFKNKIPFLKKKCAKFSWESTSKKFLSVIKDFKNYDILDSELNPNLLVRTFNDKNSDNISAKKRILLLKLDHMGDFILTVPTFNLIKEKFSDYEIDLICGSWNREFVEDIKIFDNVYFLDYFKKISFEEPDLNNNELKKILRSVSGSYEYAIDLRRHSDTRSILLKFKAENYVGFFTNQSEIDSKLTFGLHTEGDIQFQLTNANLSTITSQVFDLINLIPSSNLSSVSNRNKFTKGVIGIFPKAGNRLKEWGDQRFCDLIQKLSEFREVKIINIYLNNRDDYNFFQILRSKKINIHNNLAYKELSNLVLKSEIVLANNSYGGHLASYLGVKTFCIYAGTSSVMEWRPIFYETTVINYEIECSPCHLKDISDCINDHQCIKKITVDDVLYCVSKLLGLKNKTFLKNFNYDYKQIDNTAIHQIKSNIGISSELKPLVASILAYNSNQFRQKHMYVDVSELFFNDSGTGIQRVVKNILSNLLALQLDFKIIPVFANREVEGYFEIKNFDLNKFNITNYSTDNFFIITPHKNDIFLGLDSQADTTTFQQTFLKNISDGGVRLIFVLYDLIFYEYPQYFSKHTVKSMNKWLNFITRSADIVCISKTVNKKLKDLLIKNNSFKQSFNYGYFYLGSDYKFNERTLSSNEKFFLNYISKSINFLMVGTLEPRKGHDFVLKCFEELWNDGYKPKLIFVGKYGWSHELLKENLLNHEMKNKKLFWLDDCDDFFLKKIYEKSQNLVIASIDEGFGLPIYEAIKYKSTVIARNIDIFREIGQNKLLYFNNSNELKKIIISTISNFNSKKILDSQNLDINVLSWKESTEMLIDVINEFTNDKKNIKKTI